MEGRQCDHVGAEIQSWLELLLQLIDITGTSPEHHLRVFLQGKQAVARKYRHISQKYVSFTLWRFFWYFVRIV